MVEVEFHPSSNYFAVKCISSVLAHDIIAEVDTLFSSHLANP